MFQSNFAAARSAAFLSRLRLGGGWLDASAPGVRRAKATSAWVSARGQCHTSREPACYCAHNLSSASNVELIS